MPSLNALTLEVAVVVNEELKGVGAPATGDAVHDRTATRTGHLSMSAMRSFSLL